MANQNSQIENSKPIKKRSKLREFFALEEFFDYFFRKKDPNRPTNFSLKMMHGVNKISIIIFLIAFVIWLVKRLS
jgi:hypothetical protein